MKSTVFFISVFSALALSLSFGSCSRSDMQKQHISRLDRVLSGYASLGFDGQVEVYDSLATEIDAMFSVLGVDHVTTMTLDDWCRSRVVEVFQPAVDSVFPDINRLEENLAYMLQAADRDSLKIPALSYATVTWGNPRPIVRVDSVMLIALNHYLGSDYPGYERWPQYRRAEKTPEQLPYDLAAALVATQYPMSMSENPALINWMLYEGVLVQSRMNLVSNADEAMALGYTDQQLQYAKDNCKRLWEEMAVRKLIYETDPAVIDRYITAAPNTPLLQSTAPGRIGRFIGYMIVKAYIKSHPGVSLVDLLSTDFYGRQQSLIDSGFNPR